MSRKIKLTPKQAKDLKKRGLLTDTEEQPIFRRGTLRLGVREKKAEPGVCSGGPISIRPFGSIDGSGRNCGGTPCGHVFIWAGDPRTVPEGYFCSCGKTKAHYAKCPTCGHEKLEARTV
jgi:hypothetical protein